MALIEYLRRHHLVLLVVALVLVSGSAYAATTLPRNSVGSPQVKQNSLTSGDIKDRTIRPGDLDPSVTADTRLVTRNLASGAPSVILFERPDIGTFSASCTSPTSIGVSFTVPATAVPASAYVSGSDIADNSPVGAAGVTAPAGTGGGGVGYGGANHLIGQGHVWVVTSDQSLHIWWSFSGCTLRAHLTFDKVPGAGPAFRITRGRATCSEVTGPATCRVG